MCSAGQYGYTNREQEQSSDRTGSYVCPYGTPTLPAPTYTGWTAWSNTATTRHVSNVCTNCPAPSTGTQTQWVGYTAAMCAAGQYGLTNRELEQSQSRSITYNCPYGTASLPAPSYGGWSAWTNTGNTRAVNNGTCASCPAAYNEANYQWSNRSAACPSGQTGSNTWQAQQVQYRSVNWNCPTGTASLPGANYGGWGAWVDTGAIQSHSNTCKTATMCPVFSDYSSSTINGGDGYYTTEYSYHGIYTTSSCSERNGPCYDAIVNAGLGMTKDQWEKSCAIGDTWYEANVPTGYSRTDWVQEETRTWTCQACP